MLISFFIYKNCGVLNLKTLYYISIDVGQNTYINFCYTHTHTHFCFFVAVLNLVIVYDMSFYLLVIVESKKNSPPISDESVLFNMDRLSIGKVSSQLTCLLGFLSMLSVWLHTGCSVVQLLFFLSGFWSVWASLPAVLRAEIQLSRGDRTKTPQNRGSCYLCSQNQRFHWLHICWTDEAVSTSFMKVYCLSVPLRINIFINCWLITLELKGRMHLGKMTWSHHQR